MAEFDKMKLYVKTLMSYFDLVVMIVFIREGNRVSEYMYTPHYYVWRPRDFVRMDNNNVIMPRGSVPGSNIRLAHNELDIQSKCLKYEKKINSDPSDEFDRILYDECKKSLEFARLLHASEAGTGVSTATDISAVSEVFKALFTGRFQIGGSASSRRHPSSGPKWLPTTRTVKHKGAVRKLWRSSKDASVLAVKRIVRAADGTRKARFEKVK